jgi:aldose 1-epimerase
MIIRSFGKLSDGRSAGLYILRNKHGMEAHLTDIGAALVSLIVPDKDGIKRDVVLGYDNAAAYEKGGCSFGGTVGRVANRISNAAFDLNGRHYILTANDGPNCLHGGRDPYVNRLWSPVIPFG